MDFLFVEYRDPMFGLLVLVALVLVVAMLHYAWRTLSSKSQKKGLEGFIKKFDIADEHKDLLRTSSLSLENLHFLAGIFTKSGEFEKAIQIYLIALEKIKDKGEQEAIFYNSIKACAIFFAPLPSTNLLAFVAIFCASSGFLSKNFK